MKGTGRETTLQSATAIVAPLRLRTGKTDGELRWSKRWTLGSETQPRVRNFNHHCACSLLILSERILLNSGIFSSTGCDLEVARA